MDKFVETVSGEDFLGFETNVQKVNTTGVQMCRKLGFQLTQNPRNEASWMATAGPDILSSISDYFSY